MSAKRKIVTPPTYEDFKKFASLWDQVEATGWIGYGEYAAHVKHSSVTRFKEVSNYFMTGRQIRASMVKAKNFEEFAHSLIGGTRNVMCEAGIADIVNDWAVVEVKSNADRELLFTAIGQALMYRQAIDPQKAAIVFAYATNIEPLKSVAKVASDMGVHVFILCPNDEVFIW